MRGASGSTRQGNPMPTSSVRMACLRDALLFALLASVPLANGAWAIDIGNGFRLGGALRYNYAYKDWDPRYDGAGLSISIPRASMQAMIAGRGWRRPSTAITVIAGAPIPISCITPGRDIGSMVRRNCMSV